LFTNRFLRTANDFKTPGFDARSCQLSQTCQLQGQGVLGQNAFADGRHLAYLRATFGDRAYMPSKEDSQLCFQTYLEEAKRRYQHDQETPGETRQIKPGEELKMVDGKLQVSGQAAVMAINGLLAKVVFEKNPDREFYVEESFPLDWMYPHLTPHAFIMKINRKPFPSLPPEAVAKDHEFWTRQQTEFIGGWCEQTGQETGGLAQAVAGAVPSAIEAPDPRAHQVRLCLRL
jgi:hypothetical protein